MTFQRTLLSYALPTFTEVLHKRIFIDLFIDQRQSRLFQIEFGVIVSGK